VASPRVLATYPEVLLEPSEVLGSALRIIPLRNFEMLFGIKITRTVTTMQQCSQMLLTVEFSHYTLDQSEVPHGAWYLPIICDCNTFFCFKRYNEIRAGLILADFECYRKVGHHSSSKESGKSATECPRVGCDIPIIIVICLEKIQIT
jgi:hypothetical protein